MSAASTDSVLEFLQAHHDIVFKELCDLTDKITPGVLDDVSDPILLDAIIKRKATCYDTRKEAHHPKRYALHDAYELRESYRRVIADIKSKQSEKK